MQGRPRAVSLSTAALVATVVGLGGCATQPAATEATALSGEVSSGLMLPDEASRMQLQSDEVFIPGQLSNSEVMPTYPAAFLNRPLPDQNVCIRFVVERDGSVRDPAPLYGEADCPASADSLPVEFTHAALDTVKQWDFYSFLRCRFPPGTPDAQKCNGPGATTEQVAVTLAYRFVFSVRDGKGRVEKQDAGR